MPAIINVFGLELEYSPIINPSVVIIPEVIPKPKPFLIDVRIHLVKCINLNIFLKLKII